MHIKGFVQDVISQNQYIPKVTTISSNVDAKDRIEQNLKSTDYVFPFYSIFKQAPSFDLYSDNNLGIMPCMILFLLYSFRSPKKKRK